MSVLSEVDINEIIKEDEGIIILNKRKESITSVGYDLTIGFIRDADTGEIPETCEYDSDRYTLLTGHRYLVISKEFLYLSSQYMATLHSRHSYALKGILVTSTTINPNHVGCIAGALFNCSSQDVYIKKDNQFATMVIHKLCTPTKIFSQKNEQNKSMDTQETFHSKFPNIHHNACEAADVYYGKIRKEIEYEYEAAMERMHAKMQAEAGSQKKRVTFLVGNGFDLNAGLNTGYKDFYNYYIKKYEHDRLAKEIKKNIENWSNLELELGRYTEEVLPGQEEEFWSSEENLENSLMDYLQGQMNRVNLKEEKRRREIGFEMERSLTKFYEKFPENVREDIKRILSDALGQIEYCFISFNYTDVLECCLKTVSERSPIYLCAEGSEKVLHVHGTISDNAVLGVNDESQIGNKEFAANALSRQRLIKKEINMLYGNTRTKKAYAAIDNSSIICIFGMSLGATDKMWWRYIAEWLMGGKDRRLIIFAKDNRESKIGKYTNICKAKMKEKFKLNGKLDALWVAIEDQIYVEVNADIFNFKLV